MTTALEQWVGRMARDCLASAGGDDEAAAVALEILLSTQPIPLSTEDVQGDLHSDATGQYVEKAGGEEPAAKSYKTARKVSDRAKAIMEAASKIPVTDERSKSVKNFSEANPDEVERAMTREELRDYQAAMHAAEIEEHDAIMETYDPEISEREVANEWDLSARRIRERIEETLNLRALFESAEDVPKIPDIPRQHYGTRAIDFFRQHMKLDDSFNSLSEAQLNRIDEQLDDLEKDVQAELEGAMESARDQAYEHAGQDLDIDISEQQRDYLRNFFNTHQDRFGGTGEEHMKWYTDSDKDGILTFQTASGSSYVVRTVSFKLSNIDVVEFVFSDQEGSYSITSSGEAMQVFSKVVPAIVAYIKGKDLPVVYFSAAEESRVRLYDRLVKTVAALVPGYFAVAAKKTHGSASYLIGKTERKAELTEKITPHLHAATVSELSGGA